LIDSAITVATEAEKLGLLGFLCLVVAVLVWVVRVVYKDREACNSARIEDANQRAEMNKELGEFKGKLEMMESLHIQALIRTRGEID